MKRIYKHSHIHNNNFETDTAILLPVTDEVWGIDYDSEIIVTRHLGNNLHIIIGIPHLCYGYQRYDVVKVDENTDLISELIHRARNTSARIIFSKEMDENTKQRTIDDLIKLNFIVDPYNINMVGVDLDKEDSREELKIKMNELLAEGLIKDWEYVIQD